MSSANSDSFTFSFPIWMPFISVSCLITVAKTSKTMLENQDDSVSRHSAPPRTTRTDRKSNGKEVPHQGNKKINIHLDR